MRTLGFGLPSTVLLLLVASVPVAADSTNGKVGLVDAVRQALESNLDLAIQERTLAADREDIEIARARLLPEVTVGAQGQILNDDRTDDSRGNVTERSVTVTAGVTQVLYDE